MRNICSYLQTPTKVSSVQQLQNTSRLRTPLYLSHQAAYRHTTYRPYEGLINVRGSHSGTVEDSSILGFYAVLTGIYRRSFETSVNTSRQGATTHKTRVSKTLPRSQHIYRPTWDIIYRNFNLAVRFYSQNFYFQPRAGYGKKFRSFLQSFEANAGIKPS